MVKLWQFRKSPYATHQLYSPHSQQFTTVSTAKYDDMTIFLKNILLYSNAIFFINNRLQFV